MKAGPERELLDRYQDRARKSGRAIGIQSVDFHEWNESREAQAERRKEEESRQLLGALRPGALLIALDENGNDMNSAEFAALIRGELESGRPEVALAIGGPDGHGGEVLGQAGQTLRFGRLTWPHQLVRVLAAEQIYRAITILSGHPYHRQ